MSKLFLIISGSNAALVILLGAFGSHDLRAKLDAEMMNIYQTGIQRHYQIKAHSATTPG